MVGTVTIRITTEPWFTSKTRLGKFLATANIQSAYTASQEQFLVDWHANQTRLKSLTKLRLMRKPQHVHKKGSVFLSSNIDSVSGLLERHASRCGGLIYQCLACKTVSAGQRLKQVYTIHSLLSAGCLSLHWRCWRADESLQMKDSALSLKHLYIVQIQEVSAVIYASRRILGHKMYASRLYLVGLSRARRINTQGRDLTQVWSLSWNWPQARWILLSIIHLRSKRRLQSLSVDLSCIWSERAIAEKFIDAQAVDLQRTDFITTAHLGLYLYIQGWS